MLPAVAAAAAGQRVRRPGRAGRRTLGITQAGWTHDAHDGHVGQLMIMPDSSARWAFCRKGHVRCGALGGAGLLPRHVPQRGQPGRSQGLGGEHQCQMVKAQSVGRSRWARGEMRETVLVSQASSALHAGHAEGGRSALPPPAADHAAGVVLVARSGDGTFCRPFAGAVLGWVPVVQRCLEAGQPRSRSSRAARSSSRGAVCRQRQNWSAASAACRSAWPPSQPAGRPGPGALGPRVPRGW